MYPSTGTIQYADSKFTVLISKATSKYKSHCNASNMHSNVYFYPPYSNSNLNNPPTPQLRDREWDFKNEDFTNLYLPSLSIANATSFTEKFIISKDALLSSPNPLCTSGSCQRLKIMPNNMQQKRKRKKQWPLHSSPHQKGKIIIQSQTQYSPG